MAKSVAKNSELSRITIDIPKASHKKLKAMAALEGKSMREVVNDLITERILAENQECRLDHTPNAETIKAIKEVKSRKGLIKAKNAADLFKKLGI
jgi:hypothetical protein